MNVMTSEFIVVANLVMVLPTSE